MKIVRFADPDFTGRIRELTASSSLFDPTIEQRAREIVDAVKLRGDAALTEFTERFDGVKLTSEQFAVTQAEILAASLKADDDLRNAVASAGKNIETFSRKALRKNWSMRNSPGATVGEKFDPFQRVGIYVPGGTAPLVSTALMTITLARVAGCREIVVCTPAGKTGEINPALLFAIRTAGATEIYRIGGAQAIAAMALGTASIRFVQKIFGPGNAYVVAAKRLLFGHVAIDLLPGPSEVLVLADETANPKFVAADLLAQAEHGSGHERVWLVTDSGKLLRAVHAEITRQIQKLARWEMIERALENNGWLIQVKTLEDGIALTNQLAPEHCEVMTRSAKKVSEKILTAGAIFLGGFSPTVLGDYVAGPSHTMPTGGTARFASPLNALDFVRITSIIALDDKTAAALSVQAARIAQAEELDAHAQSALLRTVH